MDTGFAIQQSYSQNRVLAAQELSGSTIDRFGIIFPTSTRQSWIFSVSMRCARRLGITRSVSPILFLRLNGMIVRISNGDSCNSISFADGAAKESQNVTGLDISGYVKS